MTTPLDLIKDAMETARVYAPGESLSDFNARGALREMNRMFGTWSNQSLLLYQYVEDTLTLVIDQASYSIGASADYDFNTARPLKILKGSFIRVSDTDYPLWIEPIEKYREIGSKSDTGRPRTLSYNPTYPYGTIYLWYTPSAADELHLLSEKPLSSIANADIDETLSLPPGYEDAIVYNLALRLGPKYGKSVRPDVVKFAQDALDSIEIVNSTKLPKVDLEVARFTNVRGSARTIEEGPFG